MNMFITSIAMIIGLNSSHAFDGNPTNMTQTQTQNLVTAMNHQAYSLMTSLNPEQRKISFFKMNSKQMHEWRYFPSPNRLTGMILPEHHGLSVAHLSKNQMSSLMNLLDLGLSGAGVDAVNAALTLEHNDSFKFRGLLNRLLFNYSPKNYFVSFFGKPSDLIWAWRFEGHHVSLTFTVDNQTGQITASPAFIGTTLGQVVVGEKDKGQTIQVLRPVVQTTKVLAQSLNSLQFKVATQSLKKVPKFNLYAPGIMGGPLKIAKPLPTGLAWSQMSENQQQMVVQVLTQYQSQFAPALRNVALARLNQGSVNNIQFILAGDKQMIKPFYFRIQGDNFILELTCSENSAEHYHSAWINL